jgi:anti-sigma factor RsiW
MTTNDNSPDSPDRGQPLGRQDERTEALIPTCRDMTERVTDYLEGTLSLPVRLITRLHLFRCDACVRYYNQMRKTIGFLADAPPAPPPAGAVDDVIASLRRQTGQSQARD